MKLKIISHWKKPPPLGTGKVGVEFAHEDYLRGLPGRERIEVNAKGQPIRVLRDVDAMSGKDLQLSIDVEVQLQAAEILRRGQLAPVELGSLQVQRALAKNSELQAHIALGDDLVLRDEKDRLVPPESGAVVVMDIYSGEVI